MKCFDFLGVRAVEGIVGGFSNELIFGVSRDAINISCYFIPSDK